VSPDRPTVPRMSSPEGVARLVHQLAAPRRAGLVALAAGLAAALAHPPWSLLPGLLGFGVLLLLIRHPARGRPLKSVFWRAWLFGLAYFSLSLWWISEAFMVDVAAHGWQAPFAVGGLAAGLALMWGAAAVVWRLLLAGWVARRGGRSREQAGALLFAAVFAVTEWLRGHILTGLPWNPPGAAFAAGGAISQFASVVGIYGLSLFALVLTSLTAASVMARPGRRWRFAAAAGLALAGVWAWGAVRLATAPAGPHGPVIRIVQANVPQTDKWDARTFAEILGRYTRLSAARGKGPRPDYVIWSETAIPALLDDYLAPGTWTAAEVEAALQPGQTLILGADRAEPATDRIRYFNSLFLLRRTADGFRRLGVYDKHHLVPFGEYFPVDSLAEATGLKKLVHMGDGFDPGPQAEVMRPDGVPPLAPMICYEGLFPGAINDHGRRAAWIVNVSNDAWFGRTSGPVQHLNLAGFRAIELGLPMARSTPTGVSAMVDAYGRTQQRIGQGEEGFIDVALPPAAPETPYHRFGDTIFWVVIIAMFIHVMALSRSGRRGGRAAVSSNTQRTVAPPNPSLPGDA
jgi:apolipoprotein N-acyltransferase